MASSTPSNLNTIIIPGENLELEEAEQCHLTAFFLFRDFPNLKERLALHGSKCLARVFMEISLILRCSKCRQIKRIETSNFQ